MAKLLIYPMNKSIVSLIRNGALLGFQEFLCISPDDFCVDYSLLEDISILDNGRPTGVLLYPGRSFYEVLESAEAVLFLGDGGDADMISDFVAAAERLSKKVLIAPSLLKRQSALQTPFMRERAIELIPRRKMEALHEGSDSRPVMLPMILLVELKSNTGLIHLEAGIDRYFRTCGYREDFISSSDISPFLGARELPNETLEHSRQDLTSFFMRALSVAEEEADLHVVSFPYEVESLLTRNAGTDEEVEAMRLSRRLNPDCTILIVPLNALDDSDSIASLEILQARLGIALDYIAVSNIVVSDEMGNEDHRYQYLSMPYNEVDKSIGKLQGSMRGKMFSLMDVERLEKVCEEIRDALQRNAEIEAF